MKCHRLMFGLATAAALSRLTAVEGGNPAKNGGSDTATVGAPEREFKQAQAKLRDLNQQISAVPRTAREPGLGTQMVEANRAFEYAATAFKSKDWLTVINESSSFLSLSQQPEAKSWLKAQFLLGRAYEEQGQLLRATRAYTRYLATFTTKPSDDLSDLTETFERLVRIATKSSESSQRELTSFLSSISAMQSPASVSDEIKYLTAVAGTNIGQRNIAIGWLSEVDGRADLPETKARAKFFRSLIAISEKDWSTATENLETLLQIDGLSKKTKDNARLSLARVLLKNKKPELSLASYSQISEESESYRDAAFEKIFLLINRGKDDEARTLAHLWLSRFANHDDATQLRVISSWLDLRAGDLTAAKASLEGTATKLTAIQSTLAKEFLGPTLRHEDALRLAKLTRGQVAAAPELEEILAMFRQLSEMNQRLADVDGAERSIIYAIAKGDLRQFKPALVNSMEQYDRLAEEALLTGSKLVFTERQRLAATMTDVDKQRLTASEHRRSALFEQQSQLARQAKRWASWAGPAAQLVQLAQEWKKLNKIASENQSIPAATDPKGTRPVGDPGIESMPTLGSFQDDQKSEQARLGVKIQSARQDMLATLLEIRKNQAANIVEQSRLNDILYLLQQYASALHEESQIIATYEPATGRVLDALDDEDSRATWGLWQDVVGNLHANIKQLKMQAGKELSSVFETLAHLDKTKEGIGRDLAHLKSILETYGGESLAGIITHFDTAISQRMARQYKWAGDLEYLTYVKSKNEQESNRKKQELEVQILSDNLRDIEQGGATQWPR
jgi:hypothetical protein